MLRTIKFWCLTTAVGMSTGLVVAAEPTVRSRGADGLPPVISVDDATRANRAPAAPARASMAARLAPPAPVAAAPTPVPLSATAPMPVGMAPPVGPAMAGTTYGTVPGGSNWPHSGSCDCEDCDPHYLFHGGRRNCECRPRLGSGSYWHTVCKPNLQDSHWGYCDQFCERPFGTAVSSHFQQQIANGQASQMMLYEYDFQERDSTPGEMLTYRGQYQLEKIANRFQQGLGPILIATATGDAQLDAARKESVERELKKMGVDIKSDQVVVRRPPTPSFNGYESNFILRSREGMVMGRGSESLSGSNAGSGQAGTGAGSFPMAR